MSDIYFYLVVTIQLLYLFILGMKTSFAGLGYVVFCSLHSIYELQSIQMGNEIYISFGMLLAMPPRACAGIFSWVMNFFMQGGFNDISRHHTYLYMIPGVIIFVSIYLFGVLGQFLQKKFAKTVDK